MQKKIVSGVVGITMNGEIDAALSRINEVAWTIPIIDMENFHSVNYRLYLILTEDSQAPRWDSVSLSPLAQFQNDFESIAHFILALSPDDFNRLKKSPTYLCGISDVFDIAGMVRRVEIKDANKFQLLCQQLIDFEKTATKTEEEEGFAAFLRRIQSLESTTTILLGIDPEKFYLLGLRAITIIFDPTPDHVQIDVTANHTVFNHPLLLARFSVQENTFTLSEEGLLKRVVVKYLCAIISRDERRQESKETLLNALLDAIRVSIPD